MKKKIITCALGLLAAIGLSACISNPSKGSSSLEDAGQTIEEFDAEVEALGDLKNLTAEVTFWHTMGKANQDVFNTMIAEFNKTYPNITINHSQQGGYPDVRKNIANAIPAHTTPTMACCYPDHVADYLPSDSVIKLDNYINSTKIGFGVDNGLGDAGKDDFIQTYLDEGDHYTLEGKTLSGYYSVPFSKSTEVLFYNKDAFETYGWTVPETWDQMWKLCATIKETLPEVTPLGYDSDANFFITYCEQAGIPYTTGEGNEHFLFNNAEAKAFVTKLKEYADKGYWTSQGLLGSGTYTSTKFTNQELLMTIGSTGGTKYNVSTNFSTGVAGLPQVDKNNGKVIMQGPSICFLNDSTFKERVAGWLFYKFVTNADNSAIWSSMTGYNPVRTSSFASKNYKTSSTPLVNDVLDFAGTKSNYTAWYYSSPAFKGSSAAREEMDSLMAGVLNGSKTVDAAFEDAYNNCLFAA